MTNEIEQARDAVNQYFEAASGFECKQCPKPSDEMLSAAIRSFDHICNFLDREIEGGWQPIETAPKDGTWIMVYWPTMGIGQYPFVVFWDEGWQPARYSDRDYGEAFPTHWMPLPPAPKKEE